MRINFFIIVFTILPAFSIAQRDTSNIVYFDSRFEAEPEIEYAKYYGIPRKIGDNRYEVVFYTFGGEKFAMGEYVGSKLRNRNGIFVRYDSKGRIVMSVTYFRSMMHGKFQRWHYNGVLADSGRIERNFYIGLWKSWWPNGQLRVMMTYQQISRNYVLTRPEGEYLSWHANGQLKDSGFYKKGIKAGLWTEWTFDGQKAIGTYNKDGWRQGDWRHYDNQGKFQYIRRFKKNQYDDHGELISIHD